MNRGAKRRAMFDTPAAGDATFSSKRVMEEPSFNVHRVESSSQHIATGTPLLDPHRAESAGRHVRALNTQFASWVQSQLQNHPDELWEDGVRDYLSHASQIMEKFKDVVDWLKANCAKEETKLDKALSTKIDASVHKGLTAPQGAGNGIAQATPQIKHASFPNIQTSSIFSPPQTSGIFSFNQAPTFSGSQDSAPHVESASGGADDDDEPQQPSSPSLKRTEEKGVIVVHVAKCKVYVMPDNPAEKGWKDIGVGQLSIKCVEGAEKATKESKPTVVIRNDVGRILLNALLYPGMKITTKKNTIATIFHTSGNPNVDAAEAGKSGAAVARTYLLRLKTEDETLKLETVMKDYAPAS